MKIDRFAFVRVSHMKKQRRTG